MIADHVPSDRIVDFDLYDPPGLEHGIHHAWTSFRDQARHSVIYTPRHGGHWVVLDGKTVHELYGDHERLSSRVTVVPRPKESAPLGAINHDPPMHRDFRMLLNRGLSMTRVSAMEPVIRAMAAELVETLLPRGECDFIAEFASILPLSVFLTMVDIPLDDRAQLLEWTEEITHPSGELDHDAVVARFWDYLLPIIHDRRETPGDDMISDIANGAVFGRKLTDREAQGACTHLIIAGLDTVASFIGFVQLHLAENTELRRMLAANPQLIRGALAELIRRFPMVTMIRLVNTDFELDGVVLKKGDLVALPTVLTNLSPELYEDPMTVDLDRRVGRIATFGNGPHRCPGSPLARAEIRIILEEWLKRIPDFSADHAGIEYGGGFVGTIRSLTLHWNAPSS